MDLSSSNSKPQQNCSDNHLDSPDRPLSPVLSTGKKSKLFRFGNRLQKRKSKINLSTRYADNLVKTECKANEIGSGDNENNGNLICKKPDTCNQTNDTLEERIRNIKAIEDKRKEFYNTLCSIPASNYNRISNTLNTNDKFCIKKPVSPVCAQSKFKNAVSSFPEIDEAASSKQKLPLHPANMQITLSSNKHQGFQTGSGKKIIISDEAMKRHAELFAEIIKDGFVTQKLDDKLMSDGFQSASGKRINISKAALQHANNLFSNESFDNSPGNTVCETQFLSSELHKLNEKQEKVVGGTINKSSLVSEIKTSINQRLETIKQPISANVGYIDHGSIGFSQDCEFTDTQINFAVDTVESAIEANDNSKRPECNQHIETENTSLQKEMTELQELLKQNVHELPKSKLHIGQGNLKAQANYALLSQDDLYFSDFMHNMIPGTDNMISNNKSDVTVKSLPMQVINDASLHCKNILSVINMVQKNLELNTNEDTENVEFTGFHNFDMDFANNKANTCKNLVDHLRSKLDDVYYFGFTEKDKEFSLRCFQNSLDSIVNIDNEIRQDVANNSKIYRNKNMCEEKQKCVSSIKKSYDDLITIYKNKKRTNHNKLLPPSKRIKYAGSSSEDTTNDNDSLPSDENDVKCAFVDKKKYTEMWCSSSFGAGCDNFSTNVGSSESKDNLSSQTSIKYSDTMPQATNYSKQREISKLDDKTNAGFCFKSASGRNIALSKESLKKAHQLFNDISKESTEKCMTSFESSVNHSPKITAVIGDKKKNDTNKGCVVLGFKSASDKVINISTNAMAQAEKLFDSVNIETNLTHGEKYGNYMEENISGIRKSSSKLKCIIEEIKESVSTIPQLVHNDVNTGFQNAAGMKLTVPKDYLMKAKNLFMNTEDSESELEAIQNTHPLENNSLKVQNSSFSNSNLESKSATKKRLGVSSCKQINIPNFKLEKAKQLFTDTDELIDISPRKPMDTSTPIKSFQSISTVKVESPYMPNKSGTLNKQSSECFKNVATPITPTGRHFMSESPKSLIAIQKETKGDVNSWLKDVEDECEYMEHQLKILQRRKKALIKQKSQLEMKPGNCQW